MPFPSVPAIRKLDDNVFPSIAAAIDPPEVVAYVQLMRAAGYSFPRTRAGVDGWLVEWAKVVRKSHIRAILRQQGVHKTDRYRRLLRSL